MAKEKRIVATDHVIVSEGIGYPSRTLAPGEHIVFSEDNDTHKSIEQEIAAGRNTGLKIEEVDLSDEDNTAAQPDTIHTDDVLQAPARALEQEVGEAPFADAKEAEQPEEAREGAEEIQESVDAEQERQADETAGDQRTGTTQRSSRRKE